MSTYPASTSLTSAQRASDTVAGDRSRSALDNLLRRELHVGDPNDPKQIAQALSERYQGDVRAQAIDGESRGLPFLRTQSIRPVDVSTPTATNVDLEQARNDVNLDLQELVSDNLTKDIRPELEGWQQVINRSIDEGISAARFGLDPGKRDCAFAVRRQLGEYARLARLVGVLTPALNTSFRGLAGSIDEVCSVMLVIMGESMANVGFAGGRFLLQAPYSELQARRDAVLNALRNVENVASNSLSNSQWPRGLRAYRQMYTVLEAQGQGDIRSLLSEPELARTLDELIQTAGGGSSTGMRALGATSWAPLNRLNRFVQTTIRQAAVTSPSLGLLHEALQLFIDGFVPAGGFRLLRIARPAVLNYGLYGPAPATAAEERLIDLVNRRGSLARRLDCLTACACDRDHVLAQIVLDKVLYDVDRAIDFYSTGDADLGLPEVRASAFSLMLEFLPSQPAPAPNPPTPALAWPGGALGTTPTYFTAIAADREIPRHLNAIRSLLRPIGLTGNTDPPPAGWDTNTFTFNDNLTRNLDWLGGGPTAFRFGQVLHDELCMQRDTDQNWRPVIEQMTSGCLPVGPIFDGPGPNFGCLPTIVDAALLIIEQATTPSTGGNPAVPSLCEPRETLIPRDPDESLSLIADRV